MLSTRFLNDFQRFALVYWLRMERREHNEDMRSAQSLQTFELMPDRWRAVHLGISDDEIEYIDGEAYTSPGEVDENELDAFLARVEKQTQGEMTGAEAGAWQDAQKSWGVGI